MFRLVRVSLLRHTANDEDTCGRLIEQDHERFPLHFHRASAQAFMVHQKLTIAGENFKPACALDQPHTANEVVLLSIFSREFVAE